MVLKIKSYHEIFLFYGFEFVVEIFFTFITPLIIKMCREEYRRINFMDIAFRHINKHSLGFLISNLLGLFTVFFILEKYGFNLIAYKEPSVLF